MPEFAVELLWLTPRRGNLILVLDLCIQSRSPSSGLWSLLVVVVVIVVVVVVVVPVLVACSRQFDSADSDVVDPSH